MNTTWHKFAAFFAIRWQPKPTYGRASFDVAACAVINATY